MRIKNLKFKIKNYRKGYTLVELLVVIGILITVGTISTSILVTSLRGGNKSNTVNDVRQEGNYIISQMSKMIQYARSFDGVSIDNAPNSYVKDCTVVVSPPTAYKYIKITSFDRNQTIFSCSGNTIASNTASLIDTTKFSIPICNFYCSQTNLTTAPTINIDFSISKVGSGLFVENQSTIPFETSVTPRNN